MKARITNFEIPDLTYCWFIYKKPLFRRDDLNGGALKIPICYYRRIHLPANVIIHRIKRN